MTVLLSDARVIAETLALLWLGRALFRAVMGP